MLLMKKNLPQRSATGASCPKFRAFLSAAAMLVFLLLVRSACANVYATNVRLNGGATNIVMATATNIDISYILNEAATAGVVININLGDATVRTINLTNPSPGTVLGTNIVAWDGKDDGGTDVGPGLYAVSITASANGYDEWTAIS